MGQKSDFILEKEIHTNEKFGIQIKPVSASLKVIDFLNKKNVDYVVLKGVTLACYNEFDRRFGDLDVFVDKENVEKICSLLINDLEYKYCNSKELKVAKKYNFNIGKHIQTEGGGNIPVEIHYDLATPGLFATEKLHLLSNIKYITINGIKVPSFPPELQLVTIMIHGVGHLFLTDFEGWFNDVNLIIKNNSVNWKKFIEIVSDLNCACLFYRAITMLNNLKNEKTAIPEDVIKELYDNSSKFRLYLTKEFDSSFYKRTDEIKKNIDSSKIHYTFWILWTNILFTMGFNKQFLKILYYKGWIQLKETIIFPPKEEIAKTFSLNPKSRKIYIYYPLKWYMSLVSIFKR